MPTKAAVSESLHMHKPNVVTIFCSENLLTGFNDYLCSKGSRELQLSANQFIIRASHHLALYVTKN